MRILQVILTPRHSGAEILARDLITSDHWRGHVLAVASLNPAEEAFFGDLATIRLAGCEVYCPDNRVGRAGRVQLFRRVLKAFHPDVVIAHGAIPAVYARLASLTTYRPPVINVLHSATCDDYAELVLRVAERALLGATAAVVCVAKEQEAAYVRRVGVPKRIRHIPNGIPLSIFRQNVSKRADVLFKLGLGPDDRYILQVGRISAVKGQLQSVSIIEPLLIADKKLNLLFVGLTEEKAYSDLLVSRISASPAATQIKMMGSRADIPDLLAHASVYIMPSAMEAHSISFIEALASAVPVVASDIPQFAFAAALDGCSLVALSDQIGWTSAVRSALERKRAPGRDLSSFDSSRCAADYISLCWEVIRP